MPASYDDHANGLGAVMRLSHGFVLARSQLPAQPNPLFINAPSGAVIFLERCGSRLHRAIVSSTGSYVDYPAANANMIIWPTRDTRPSQLSGLFLPDLRRFVIRTPFDGARRYVSQLVAGPRNLYATVDTPGNGLNPTIEVWATRNPRSG